MAIAVGRLDYVERTRPGASHLAADTMSRISTPEGEERAVPDTVPCLTFPNSSVA